MNNYNNKLQTNNTNLQNILTSINNLPEAGTSSGGIETCTVTFAEPESPFISVPANDIVTYINKDETAITQQWIPNETILTVKKGTFIVICNWINTGSITPDNTVKLFSFNGSYIYRIDDDAIFIYN